MHPWLIRDVRCSITELLLNPAMPRIKQATTTRKKTSWSTMGKLLRETTAEAPTAHAIKFLLLIRAERVHSSRCARKMETGEATWEPSRAAPHAQTLALERCRIVLSHMCDVHGASVSWRMQAALLAGWLLTSAPSTWQACLEVHMCVYVVRASSTPYSVLYSMSTLDG